MNHEYKHYKNYPMDKWRWPDFTPREMRSKGDNRLMINPDSMDKLQALRDMVGPISITSAYRSLAHNTAVGGAKTSQHMKARAFDCSMHNHANPFLFELAAREVGFTDFGFYRDSNFIHIDDRGRGGEWGDRWFGELEEPVPAKPTNLIGSLLAAILGLFRKPKGK